MILYGSNIRPKRIHISENKLFLLSEDVYTNRLDRNAKRANITYKKGQSISPNASRAPKEAIKTDKMDKSGSDTYIVPLKGGINSYNITDIDGKEIMHYFKRHFSSQDTSLQIKINGKTEDYKLNMEDSEFQSFLRQFIDKISFIVADYVSKHQELTNGEMRGVSQICVYPVKSSSNFNSEIVDKINQYNQTIFGLPVVKLNETLLRKDVSKMQKDEDFLAKNADYYNSYREKGRVRNHGDETHMNGLNTDLNMLKARQEVHRVAEELNQMTDYINTLLPKYINSGDERIGQELATLFIKYGNLSKPSEIKDKYSVYQNDYTKELMTKSNYNPKGKEYIFFEPLTDTQIDQNSYNVLRNLAKTYEPQAYRNLGQYAYNIQVLKRKPLDFQIKKVFNDTRMALKNFFSFDPEQLEQARKQIEGNILVIFDDNISGGATLSDICMQFANIGIKYIVPITFGKMFTQWGGRGPSGAADDWYNLSTPPNGFVFGDNKTFVFNGKTFNTDKITNPMDAANLYQETFGTYDKKGATELWNTYKNVMASNGKSVSQQSNSALQQQQKVIDGEGTKGRGRRPYSEEERQRIINTTTETLNELIKQKNVVKQQMKSASSRQELNYLANEKRNLDKQIMIARSKIYNLQIHRTMTDGAKMRAAQKRMQSV